MGANDDARYSGSFFTVYTNSRMKLHRHCVPLNDDPEKISKVYGYDRAEVDRIYEELNADLAGGAAALKAKYQKAMDAVFSGRDITLVCIGDQMTSEYLSYYNIIRLAAAQYPGFSSYIAGNTGDTSNQSVQYMYNLAMVHEPDIAVLFIGTNDIYRSNDEYGITVTSREEYRANLDYLIKVLRHHACKTILCNIPPVDEAAAANAYAHMNWIVENSEVDARNEMLRELAAENGIKLCDIHGRLSGMGSRVTLDGNGVLLTRDAQRCIADAVMGDMLGLLRPEEEGTI